MARQAAEEAEKEFPSDRDLKIIDLSLGRVENRESLSLLNLSPYSE